jgi:hypothetical protein
MSTGEPKSFEEWAEQSRIIMSDDEPKSFEEWAEQDTATREGIAS